MSETKGSAILAMQNKQEQPIISIVASVAQRVNRNQAKINAHTSELIGGEGARFYRRGNKQTECFLSQIWPSFWPFFSSLHLAV